jgi:hypothetical protein
MQGVSDELRTALEDKVLVGFGLPNILERGKFYKYSRTVWSIHHGLVAIFPNYTDYFRFKVTFLYTDGEEERFNIFENAIHYKNDETIEEFARLFRTTRLSEEMQEDLGIEILKKASIIEEKSGKEVPSLKEIKWQITYGGRSGLETDEEAER